MEDFDYEKNKKILFIASIILVFSVLFSGIGVFACEYNNDDYSYIEFTVPEKSSTQTFSEDVTVLSEWEPGKAFTAQGSSLTASAKGENMGITVSVKLRVKGLLNQYYDVSNSSRTFSCDGSTHNLYYGFSIASGKTYRIYYKANGSTTQCPDVYLAAIVYN